jgi:dienelactone hydrolase
LPSSYWLDLRNYNPVAAAEALKIPMLILQGQRDFQSPPATNFDKWKAALADRNTVTLKLYPSLNHLFISGTGPSLPQEYEKPGHVDEQVVADIAAWISEGKLPPPPSLK